MCAVISRCHDDSARLPSPRPSPKRYRYPHGGTTGLMVAVSAFLRQKSPSTPPGKEIPHCPLPAESEQVQCPQCGSQQNNGCSTLKARDSRFIACHIVRTGHLKRDLRHRPDRVEGESTSYNIACQSRFQRMHAAILKREETQRRIFQARDTTSCQNA